MRLNIVANPATMRDVFGGVAVVKEVWRQGWKIAGVRIVVTAQEEAALPHERMLAEHCRRASGKVMGVEMMKMLKGSIFENLVVEVEHWGMEKPEGHVLDVLGASIVSRMAGWAPRGLVVTAGSMDDLAGALATLKERGRAAKFGVVVALPVVEEDGGEWFEHWELKKWWRPEEIREEWLKLKVDEELWTERDRVAGVVAVAVQGGGHSG